jgi:hypothetical protein
MKHTSYSVGARCVVTVHLLLLGLAGLEANASPTLPPNLAMCPAGQTTITPGYVVLSTPTSSTCPIYTYSPPVCSGGGSCGTQCGVFYASGSPVLDSNGAPLYRSCNLGSGGSGGNGGSGGSGGSSGSGGCIALQNSSNGGLSCGQVSDSPNCCGYNGSPSHGPECLNSLGGQWACCVATTGTGCNTDADCCWNGIGVKCVSGTCTYP